MGKRSRTTDAVTGEQETPLTLEAILAEHQEVIQRYVERRGFRGADRDDMVQEIFHGAARSLHRFDPRLGTMRVWLLRIAFNLTSKERKRAHRRHEELWPAEALDGLTSEAPDSETRLLAAQRSEALAGWLQEVPPLRRDILVAHDLEEKTLQEIAERRAMSSNTVWNHLRLARLSLKAAERRHRARHRGRGVLIAPLAAAFGAPEARASGDLLRGGLLRRAQGWIRRGLRRVLSHGQAGTGHGEPDAACGDAGSAASAPRASPVSSRPLRRHAAAVAAGVTAGALLLLAPFESSDVRESPAHATALRAPQITSTAPRGEAFRSVPGTPSKEVAAGAAMGALEAPSEELAAVAAMGALEAPSEELAAVAPMGARETSIHASVSPRRAPRGPGVRLTPELRLMRRAITTLATGRHHAARLLLERHRREFPVGAYAGDRETLLRRLPLAARPE
ncbi:sigma-70 family RNA polymerase sigma factor [Sorangium sp. So ce1036]|uniref:RNA polymerase sigma factor n=1 Tax=Sorangium sp. So ce1036 TaxID=3133328 RepID=UPI003F0BC4EF